MCPDDNQVAYPKNGEIVVFKDLEIQKIIKILLDDNFHTGHIQKSANRADYYNDVESSFMKNTHANAKNKWAYTHPKHNQMPNERKNNQNHRDNVPLNFKNNSSNSSKTRISIQVSRYELNSR